MSKKYLHFQGNSGQEHMTDTNTFFIEKRNYKSVFE